ncbi:MAG: FAD-dependent 5-carboxymethylaminomethyl-2-thiouridine(34) oxidoreductase MnmC [Simplicispira suum]|uniref:FAD-dependent 5-carboxymethylaminomethyl-2-thiouridine(34) oxidoreductase MnmC n=1 Tax=Simplicispira suum TaxID=2109915 RepID=UPI001C6B2A94|nr:FAD-dependent 5-carboxymethylaminomethyl-2-thiouridine(34) oxidoreductase MnmC [Simplicispira suum]MBW7834618.1 FAD-dependent 5-carboxymethylaminomethyl-2-thiouridine(34) oxidoreductase MnmC [Simplicispira suum]
MAEGFDGLDDTPPTGAGANLLLGCGLPAAWADQNQWRILETAWGDGQNFLHSWAAWRADAKRPRLLHFIALSAEAVAAEAVLRAAAQHPELQSLAQTLAEQCWGLLPGVHRLRFEGGRVLLTLGIGDAPTLLREQAWTVDSIFLNASVAEHWVERADLHAFKALARCCRRGTRLATDAPSTGGAALAQYGFQMDAAHDSSPDTLPKPAQLSARFDPDWEPRGPRANAQPTPPMRCVVIGAGVAGAACAASLARRGWQVQVLDTGTTPAAGASSLPVGVFAPHLSPDDNLFSRLSRSGVRAMLQQCAELLRAGVDWCASGVLERRPAGHLGLPADWGASPGADWSQKASAETLLAAGLPQEDSACWHARAGWARPARLVAALLTQPGIAWRAEAQVAHLQRVTGQAGDAAPVWQLLDTQGQAVAEAELVVLAAGAASNALLADMAVPLLPLQPVRGQMSWGRQNAQSAWLPPFPVNGNGGLVAHVPMEGGGHAWHMGSTFERDVAHLPLTEEERAAAHVSNWQHLHDLLPQAATALQSAFDPADSAAVHSVQAWASVRCTARDRLPIVGPLNPTNLPGLWVCTAMGARGLTRAVLCGELLAARLHGEPLPVESRLARAMSSERCLPKGAQIPFH